MTLDQAVIRAIDEVVRHQFDMVPITEVAVEEDEDFHGDPILRVRVVLDAEVKDLDPDRLVSITRHLRSRLWDMDETRFPHTSFITKADFEEDVAA